jgi:hypothetical protein
MAYDKAFYETRHQRTLHSARQLLGFIQGFHAFRSAVDFGCGIGTWLHVAKDLGATRVRGFDGPWVPKEFLRISHGEFTEFNFEKDALPDERYDLSISLEVAEHLPAAQADAFVAHLCQAAPAVLFGAAVPWQGGNGHVNEQWLSYWSAKFAQRGYRAHDVVRPHVWDDPDIPFWYKQNVVLYVREGAGIEVPTGLPSFGARDLVHPELYRIRANPSLIERGKLFFNTPKYVAERLKRP